MAVCVLESRESARTRCKKTPCCVIFSSRRRQLSALFEEDGKDEEAPLLLRRRRRRRRRWEPRWGGRGGGGGGQQQLEKVRRRYSCRSKLSRCLAELAAPPPLPFLSFLPLFPSVGRRTHNFAVAAKSAYTHNTTAKAGSVFRCTSIGCFNRRQGRE